MTILKEVVADWKHMRASLRRQLELLVSGKMGTDDQVLRSTSTETIQRVKRCIAEIDGLLAEHDR